jgi:hypothetical protein
MPVYRLDNGGERGHGSQKDDGRAASARRELTLNRLTEILLQHLFSWLSLLNFQLAMRQGCQNGSTDSDDHHEMRRLLP